MRRRYLARCGGAHTAHLWLVAALAEIVSEARGALGVGVEVFTDPMMCEQLPNGSDGLPTDLGVLHYYGIRGSKLAIDPVVTCLFGLSSPCLPKSLYAVLRTREVLERGEESPRHLLYCLCGHGIWFSRRSRSG
jgi:hypothetical protein